MKNVILIHGYNGIPKIYNWLQEKLTNDGYTVTVPEFPPREGVIYSTWKEIMNNYKEYFNKETIVVCHSIGNEFLIKYLNENDISIKIYISLAGFCEYFEHEGRDDLNRAVKEFLVDKEEINKFKKLVRKSYSIYSDNDHIVPFDVLENFANDIKSTPILIKGIGHMGKKSGLETIPEVLEIIGNEEK